MAAKKEGTSITKVQKCQSRNQFLSQGGQIVSSERMSNGGLVELYRFQKERGSAARAFVHGALDMWTCGIWEVIGTPLEGSIDKDQFFCVKVIYDSSDRIKGIN